MIGPAGIVSAAGAVSGDAPKLPSVSEPSPLRAPLPQEEFEAIFSRVPRLTVEVVIATPETGVLLSLRDIPPCVGLGTYPGAR